MRRFTRILIVAFVLSTMRLGLPAFAATGRSVDDESGLLSADTIAQIDARNEQLRDATGVIVAVLIVPGSNGETESALRTRADALFKDKYGALLYVSISPEVTDIIFADQGMRWIPDGQRTALRNELDGNLRYCCHGDGDRIAGTSHDTQLRQRPDQPVDRLPDRRDRSARASARKDHCQRHRRRDAQCGTREAFQRGGVAGCADA